MDNEKLYCRWQNCDKSYLDAEHLYNHLTNDHVGRKSTGNLCLTCHWERCGISVDKRDHITSHLRVHVPLKPHSCNFCDKAFKRPQDLKKHEKIHNEEQAAALRSYPPEHHDLLHTFAPHQATLSDQIFSSTSDNASSMQHLHVSSPQSTNSEDSSPHSIFSPRTDAADHFGQHGTPPPNANHYRTLDASQPQQLISNLFSPVDLNVKPQYNADMANYLSSLDDLLCQQTIRPEDFVSYVQNESQFDIALGQLSQLSSEMDSYLSTNQSTASVPTLEAMSSSSSLYNASPMSFESDISGYGQNSTYHHHLDLTGQYKVPEVLPSAQQPMMYQKPELGQGQYAQQHTLDYAFPTSSMGHQQQQRTNHYGDLNAIPEHYYNPYSNSYVSNVNNSGMPSQTGTENYITSCRPQYIPLPDIVDDGFIPNVVYSQQLHTAEGNESYKIKGSKAIPPNPLDVKVSRDAVESLTPTKQKPTTYEDKKNITTMTALYNPSGEIHMPASPQTKERNASEKLSTGRSVADTSVSASKTSSSVSPATLKMLEGDLQRLSLSSSKNSGVTKDYLASKNQNALYPSTPSSGEAQDTVHRHRKLVLMIQQWLKDSYAKQAKRDDGAKSVSSSSLAVPVN